jgi:hypothetical protein
MIFFFLVILSWQDYVEATPTWFNLKIRLSKSRDENFQVWVVIPSLMIMSKVSDDLDIIFLRSKKLKSNPQQNLEW